MLHSLTGLGIRSFRMEAIVAIVGRKGDLEEDERFIVKDDMSCEQDIK